MKYRPFLRTAITLVGAKPLLRLMGKEISGAIAPATTRGIALASLAIGVLGLALPLSMVQVYDRIVAYRSTSTLVWLFGGCALALCLEALVSVARGRISAWAVARVASTYEIKAVTALLSAEGETVADIGPGEHLERLGAGRILASMIAQALPALAESPFALLYLAVLWLIGGPLALIPVAGVLIQLIVSAFEVSRSAEKHLRLSAIEQERIEEISRSLGNIGFVKAQALEPILAMRFERTQSVQADAAYSAKRGVRVTAEFQRFISAAMGFAVLALGASAVARGALTVGALSTVLLLASRAMGSAQGFVRIAYQRAETGIATEHALKALGIAGPEEKARPPLPTALESRLEFAEVASRAGTPDGFGPTSFVLRPGDSLGLLDDGQGWASGLCFVAAGLRRPDSGSVILDVYPLDRWESSSNGVIAYVPPKGELLPGTVLDNLTGFNPALRDSALDAAAILGLEKPIARLPRGYDTPLDPRAELLPAALVQRLCIARSIARRPRLLVWNRADAGLDEEGRRAVLDLLGRLSEGTTLVVASRRKEFVGICGKVGEPFEGRIVVREAPRPMLEVAGT
ncbi:MAG: ABC transporter transmembrane domain-containing protein [Spirochaetota bacterium]